MAALPPQSPAKASYSSKISQARYKNHLTGIKRAVQGVGSVFNRSHRRIHVDHSTDSDSYAYTTTTQGDTFRSAQIHFNPSLHTGTKDEVIAKSAETFAHELFVHARHDLNNNRQAATHSTGAHDHDQMHSPAHRNDFLRVARDTFNLMSNANQKRAFASEYAKDVISEIDSSSASTAQKRGRRRWARARRDSMIDKITNPHAHGW